MKEIDFHETKPSITVRNFKNRTGIGIGFGYNRTIVRVSETQLRQFLMQFLQGETCLKTVPIVRRFSK